jgi:ABC-type branched-subunit amino acid transport system ATPase component
VEDIADHCVILQAGKIAAEGDPAVLLRDHALLERANLVHAHRHRHGSEITHSHPHRHPHSHD